MRLKVGSASFAALIGVPIAGAIIKANGGAYTGLIILAGVSYFAAVVAFTVTSVVVGGWRWKVC